MVVRGDLDLTCREVLDRLIAAPVTKFQFVRRSSKCFTKKLMAEADAENRFFGGHESLDLVYNGSHCGGGSRAVWKENNVRVGREDTVGRRVGPEDRYPAAQFCGHAEGGC